MSDSQTFSTEPRIADSPPNSTLRAFIYYRSTAPTGFNPRPLPLKTLIPITSWRKLRYPTNMTDKKIAAPDRSYIDYWDNQDWDTQKSCCCCGIRVWNDRCQAITNEAEESPVEMRPYPEGPHSIPVDSKSSACRSRLTPHCRLRQRFICT